MLDLRRPGRRMRRRSDDGGNIEERRWKDYGHNCHASFFSEGVFSGPWLDSIYLSERVAAAIRKYRD
jgi:hypothetical protein